MIRLQQNVNDINMRQNSLTIGFSLREAIVNVDAPIWMSRHMATNKTHRNKKTSSTKKPTL